jgi:hypothetical protein
MSIAHVPQLVFGKRFRWTNNRIKSGTYLEFDRVPAIQLSGRLRLLT